MAIGTTNRRGVLKFTAAGLAAGAIPVAGHTATGAPSTLVVQQPGRDYRAAIAKLRAYALAELEAVGQPGMVIAIVDADGFAATLSVGWANLDGKLPVRPNQLFEIGSISKSLTALCLHSLADEGKIDLDAPISRYVDSASLPPTPITLALLLNHTGGLSQFAPIFPDNPEGRLWSGFEPGSRFSYSFVGYELLGLAIGRVTGKPHPEVIRERVLLPLGMNDAVAHLIVADRARFATGYVPLIEDRPILLRPEIMAGPLHENDAAYGSIGASGEAMIAYLRYVIALGRGHGGPLFSDARAKALLANDIENDQFGPRSRYASGFATVPIDGRPTLHHTAGTGLFTSSFHVDPKTGAGCFASVNGRIGPYRPRKITYYSMQLMRAVQEGRPLPDAPDPIAFRRVEHPTPWIGRWYGPDGRVVELAPDAAMGLKLRADGHPGRIEANGESAIVTDHPAYCMHAFEIDHADPSGARLWWGSMLFGRDTAPAQPVPDPSLLPYEGVYSAVAPWYRRSLLVRGNRLFSDTLGEIVKRPGGFWSPKDDVDGVSRLWLDKTVNGSLGQLSFYGLSLSRLS